MKFNRLLLLTIICCCSCNQENNVTFSISVKDNNLVTDTELYISNDVIYGEGIKLARLLESNGDYSPDRLVLYITNNNQMIIFKDSLNITNVINLNTGTTTIYTLKAAVRNSTSGLDIPIEDLGIILGYTVTITNNSIFFI